MNGAFFAGAARRDITPPVGTALCGYYPDFSSTAVHDRLQVTALALRQNGTTVLLVNATLLSFQTALSNEIRRHIQRQCGVPYDHILLAATHTHAAPNVLGIEGWGAIDRAYCDGILLPAVLDSCREALVQLQPAEVALGETSSAVGVNRRQRLPDGRVILGQNPRGCYEPCMTVLSVRSERGDGILNLLHYGCHGTAAGCTTEITRDWSGVAIDRLEEATGVPTVFWNGAMGDVGPRLPDGRTAGDIRAMEALGEQAAADALAALGRLGGYRRPVLAVGCGEVFLPYRPFPSLQEVQQRLHAIRHPEKLFNSRRLEYTYLHNLEMHLSGAAEKAPAGLAYRQTVVAVGDLVLVPFPFEVFSKISLQLRAHSPYPHTWLLSAVNGYYGYLPSQDQIDAGGYEIDVFLTANLYTLTDDTDQRIIRENLQMIRQLREAAGTDI